MCKDEFRLALVDAIKKYTQQALPQGKTLLCRHNDKYSIVTVGDRFQLENMRNGQWRSVWVLDPTNKIVTGQLRAMVHYFEDGNVQLNTKRDCEFSWDLEMFGQDWHEAARDLVKMIKTKEDEVQVAVNEAYGQLADTTFKKLRRQLPITRSKVDWYLTVCWFHKSIGANWHHTRLAIK